MSVSHEAQNDWSHSSHLVVAVSSSQSSHIVTANEAAVAAAAGAVTVTTGSAVMLTVIVGFGGGVGSLLGTGVLAWLGTVAEVAAWMTTCGWSDALTAEVCGTSDGTSAACKAFSCLRLCVAIFAGRCMSLSHLLHSCWSQSSHCHSAVDSSHSSHVAAEAADVCWSAGLS